MQVYLLCLLAVSANAKPSHLPSNLLAKLENLREVVGSGQVEPEQIVVDAEREKEERDEEDQRFMTVNNIHFAGPARRAVVYSDEETTMERGGDDKKDDKKDDDKKDDKKDGDRKDRDKKEEGGKKDDKPPDPYKGFPELKKAVAGGVHYTVMSTLAKNGYLLYTTTEFGEDAYVLYNDYVTLYEDMIMQPYWVARQFAQQSFRTFPGRGPMPMEISYWLLHRTVYMMAKSDAYTGTGLKCRNLISAPGISYKEDGGLGGVSIGCNQNRDCEKCLYMFRHSMSGEVFGGKEGKKGGCIPQRFALVMVIIRAWVCEEKQKHLGGFWAYWLNRVNPIQGMSLATRHAVAGFFNPITPARICDDLLRDEHMNMIFSDMTVPKNKGALGAHCKLVLDLISPLRFAILDFVLNSLESKGVQWWKTPIQGVLLPENFGLDEAFEVAYNLVAIMVDFRFPIEGLLCNDAQLFGLENRFPWIAEYPNEMCIRKDPSYNSLWYYERANQEASDAESVFSWVVRGLPLPTDISVIVFQKFLLPHSMAARGKLARYSTVDATSMTMLVSFFEEMCTSAVAYTMIPGGATTKETQQGQAQAQAQAQFQAQAQVQAVTQLTANQSFNAVMQMQTQNQLARRAMGLYAGNSMTTETASNNDTKIQNETKNNSTNATILKRVTAEPAKKEESKEKKEKEHSEQSAKRQPVAELKKEDKDVQRLEKMLLDALNKNVSDAVEAAGDTATVTVTTVDASQANQWWAPHFPQKQWWAKASQKGQESSTQPAPVAPASKEAQVEKAGSSEASSSSKSIHFNKSAGKLPSSQFSSFLQVEPTSATKPTIHPPFFTPHSFFVDPELTQQVSEASTGSKMLSTLAIPKFEEAMLKKLAGIWKLHSIGLQQMASIIDEDSATQANKVQLGNEVFGMSFAYPEITGGQGMFEKAPTDFLESLIKVYQKVEAAYVVDLSSFGVTDTNAPGAGKTACYVNAKMLRAEAEMWLKAFKHMKTVKDSVAAKKVAAAGAHPSGLCKALWEHGAKMALKEISGFTVFSIDSTTSVDVAALKKARSALDMPPKDQEEEGNEGPKMVAVTGKKASSNPKLAGKR